MGIWATTSPYYHFSENRKNCVELKRGRPSRASMCAKKVYEIEDGQIPTNSVYEWMVCRKLQLQATLTTCCARVICVNCTNNVKTCPRRWGIVHQHSLEPDTGTSEGETKKKTCTYCDDDIHKTNLPKHQERCRKQCVSKMAFVGKMISTWYTPRAESQGLDESIVSTYSKVTNI